MALSAGTRLGPYEILAALGAGGMGEVYRARDAKLNRDVALKVLPALFASDSDRLARFKREAQVLASLHHSNIAAIYGFEECDVVPALVMELVDATRSRIAAPTARFPWTTRCRSPDRSPRRWRRPTSKASSIAI